MSSTQYLIDSMDHSLPPMYRAALKATPGGSLQVVSVSADKTAFTSVEEALNDHGDSFDYDQADTGSTLEAVSTSGADTIMIQLSGLDINKDMATEIVQLTGTAPVTTVNVFTRLNSVLCLDAHPAGTVTITALGFTWGRLPPGGSNMHAGRYAIPRGHRFIPEISQFFSDKAGEYRIRIYQRLPGLPAIEAMPIYLYRSTGELRPFPTVTQGPADIYLCITKLSGSGSLYASGLFNGLLVKD